MGKVAKLKRTWDLAHCSIWKDYWKLLPLLISISWPGLVTSWVAFHKIYSKMYLVSCANTHRHVADSVNHGMLKNTKTWISWERNVIFLRNKKFLICATDDAFWEVIVKGLFYQNMIIFRLNLYLFWKKKLFLLQLRLAAS